MNVGVFILPYLYSFQFIPRHFSYLLKMMIDDDVCQQILHRDRVLKFNKLCLLLLAIWIFPASSQGNNFIFKFFHESYLLFLLLLHLYNRSAKQAFIHAGFFFQKRFSTTACTHVIIKTLYTLFKIQSLSLEKHHKLCAFS